MSASIINTSINKLSGKDLITTDDFLAVEEPLEIRLSYVSDFRRIEKNISITMRTPGDDEDLATGFLLTEGIIENAGQITNIESSHENIITVSLREDVSFDMEKLERHFYTSSSCGVCGKSSIDAVTVSRNNNFVNNNTVFNSSVIYSLPSILRNQQEVFKQTGGLHASAIFNTEGKLLLLREDVGRHNALDKLIGAAMKKNMLPLDACLLLLSGRASFELIQKAYMAHIAIVASVGAPSSLAVEFAKEKQITLIGFLGKERFNLYSGAERVMIED